MAEYRNPVPIVSGRGFLFFTNYKGLTPFPSFRAITPQLNHRYTCSRSGEDFLRLATEGTFADEHFKENELAE